MVAGQPYVPHFRFARSRRVIFASRARSTSNVWASIWRRGRLLCCCLLAPSPSVFLTFCSCRQSARLTLRSTVCCLTKRWISLLKTTATAMPTRPARRRVMQNQPPAAIPSRGKRVNERSGPTGPVFTVDSGSHAVICKSLTIHQHQQHNTVYSRLGESYRPR